MKIRIVAVAVAVAAFAAGCGKDTCPTEAPQVSALAQDCQVPAGQAVTYPLRLCPTCNQTLTGCTAEMSGANASGGTIFLNPTVEVCSSSNSCPPSCSASTATCTFTPPSTAAGVSYDIQVYDPASGETKQGKVTFTSGAVSCSV